MARSYARILTTIWTDPDFVALTTHAQRAYMLILSQPHITNLGMLPYTPRRWARLANDTDQDTITAAIAELADHHFVLIDHDTEELWVRSFIRHDGGMKVPNIRKAMAAEHAAILSPRLRCAVTEALHNEQIAVSAVTSEPVAVQVPDQACAVTPPSPNGTTSPQVTTHTKPLPKPLPERVSNLRQPAAGNRQPTPAAGKPAAAPPDEPVTAPPAATPEPAGPPAGFIDQCIDTALAWRWHQDRHHIRRHDRWATTTRAGITTDHAPDFTHTHNRYPDLDPIAIVARVYRISQHDLHDALREYQP